MLFPVCGTLTGVQPAAAAAGAAMASPASTDNAVTAAPASAHRLWYMTPLLSVELLIAGPP